MHVVKQVIIVTGASSGFGAPTAPMAISELDGGKGVSVGEASAPVNRSSGGTPAFVGRYFIR